MSKWSWTRQDGRVERISDLGDKDQEHLRMAVQGMTNKEIAAVRGVSENAIKQSLHRVYERLGIEGGKCEKRAAAAERYDGEYGASGTDELWGF